MTGIYADSFNRKISGGERSMLMLPFNVVTVANIQGAVDRVQLINTIGKLRKRHALLAVRVVLDEQNVAWFTGDGVPDPDLEVINRKDDTHWVERAETEFNNAFYLEQGPLARFIMLHSPDATDLIITAHHVVCDGTSLIYLIRDLLQQLAELDREVEALPVPPVIDHTTVPSPPPIKPIQRKIIGLLNKKWEKKNFRFGLRNMEELHKVFWEQNAEKKLLPWILSQQETQALVAQCRKNNVTVNTALWTAFLAAQHEVQFPLKAYHQKSGMAVSTRRKLLVPVGEALGFYASSLTVHLKYNPQKSFWENAAIVHQRINKELKKTQLFRMLIADLLNPSLLDSLYFNKYGLMKSWIASMFLKKMNFHKVSYGYSITNVGKMSIPISYGSLQLKAVYGPAVYSDVNEKLIGVVTVGDRASFMMTYNKKNLSVDKAEQIRDTAMRRLSEAVSR